MNVLQPITITDAMLGASTSLAEDSTAAWVSGATYSVGDERHVVATHRVYRDSVGGVSSTTPQNDPVRWVDMRPTNRWAPFDFYTSTAATSTTSNIVYQIAARFVNAIAIYGVVGANYNITVKDQAGGAVIWQRSGVLRRHDKGWYNYLFGSRIQVRRLIFFGIPIRPTAEVTITISAGAGATRAIGLIAMGKLRPLQGGFIGGSEKGATVEPVSYSYIKTDPDGVTTIVKRHSGTNLRARVFIDQKQANAALNILQDVLDVPCAWIVSEEDGYQGLSTFGIASSGPIQYETPHAYIDISVKGLI